MKNLARSALSNLSASLLPALVMLVTVPVLVHGLGDAQYGLLVILSSVTGYLAILDLNLTAGSVRYLAAAQAREQQEQSWQVLSLGSVFYFAIGLLGALLIWVFADRLVDALVDPALYARDQAASVLRVTSLGFLLGQLYSFLLSVPQALQRYDLSSRVELINGTLVPVATAGIVLLGADLTGVTWLRNIAALFAVFGLALMVRHLLPGLRWRWPANELRRELLAFSGFAYLNRLAALSYQHSDKIVIAAVLDVKQVAVYTVPVVLANRIMGTTFRLTQVLFPASSALLAQGRDDDVRRIMTLGMRLVVGINVIAVVGTLILGDWFLVHWLGRGYSGIGSTVLGLISVGSLIGSITNAPSLVTDGAGRPGLTGAVAIAHSVVALFGLYAGAHLDGIRGVATAHLVTSCIFSAAFLAIFCKWVLPMSFWKLLRDAVLPGALVGVVGGVVAWAVWLLVPVAEWLPLVQFAAAVVAMTMASWQLVLTAEIRERVANRIRSSFKL